MYNVPTTCFNLNHVQFNLIISALASLLFFSGWWIVADIDVHNVLVNYPEYYIPGVVATLAFFCINIIPAHYFYDTMMYSRGCFSPAAARTYLFVWLMISFGSLISVFFILINDFVLHPEKYQWPGFGICNHNIFIFTSNMLLRFARKHEQF